MIRSLQNLFNRAFLITLKISACTYICVNIGNSQNHESLQDSIDSYHKTSNINKLEYFIRLQDSILAKSSTLDSLAWHVNKINKANLAYKNNEYDKALHFYSISEVYFQKRQNYDHLSTIYLGIGNISFKKRDIPNANVYYKKAAAASLQNNDSITYCKTYLNLANLEQASGNFDSSLAYIYKIRSLTKDSILILKTYHIAHKYYFSKSDYLQVLKICENALELAKRLKQPSDIFQLQLQLSNIYAELKNYQESLLFAQNALETAQRHNIIDQQTTALINVANAFMELEEHDKSIEHLLKAKKLGKSLDNPFLTGHISFNIGSHYLIENNLILAEQYLKEAEQIFESIHFQDGLINVNIALGNLARKNKNYTLSKNLLEHTLPNIDTNDYKLNMLAHQGLYQVYEKEQNYRKALYSLKEVQRLQDKILENSAQQQMKKVFQEYIKRNHEQEIEIKNNNIKILEHQNSEQKRNMIILITVGLLITLTCIIIILLVNKRAKEREYNLAIISQKLNKSLKINEDLIQELRQSKYDLKSKTEVIDYLEQRQPKNKNINVLTELIRGGLNTHENRAAFTNEFKFQYAGFYNALTSSFQNLTDNDLRIASLIKLGLSTNEIAEVLRISLAGAKKARQRLREKMSLNEEESLNDILQKTS